MAITKAQCILACKPSSTTCKKQTNTQKKTLKRLLTRTLYQRKYNKKGIHQCYNRETFKGDVDAIYHADRKNCAENKCAEDNKHKAITKQAIINEQRNKTAF